MKEPPADIRSDGSFIVYEREIGQKMGEKRPKTLKNAKKSARQFYQNHRADLVGVFITDLILMAIRQAVETYSLNSRKSLYL